MLKKLVRLANNLDRAGLYAEAELADKILSSSEFHKMALDFDAEFPDYSEPEQSEVDLLKDEAIGSDRPGEDFSSMDDEFEFDDSFEDVSPELDLGSDFDLDSGLDSDPEFSDLDYGDEFDAGLELDETVDLDEDYDFNNNSVI